MDAQLARRHDRPDGPKPWATAKSQSPAASLSLLNNPHLFCIHSAAMHLEPGQGAGDLPQVFRGQYKFGGCDVLQKVLDLARAGDRDDEWLLGQEPGERQLRRSSAFSLRKFADAIDKRFIGGYVFRPEKMECRTHVRPFLAGKQH